MTRLLLGVGAGGGGPGAISGLQLWLDADDASTITIATGVSQWNDKSPNANHITQGTAANQPAYVAGVLNGKAVVRFDGTNDFLTKTSAIGLDNTTAYTLYALHTRSFTSSNRDLMATEGAGLVWRFRAVPGNGSLTYAGTYTISGTTTGSRALAAVDVFKIAKVVYDGANQLYTYNGATDTDAATAALIDEADPTYKLGDTSGAVAWEGDVAEILFYNRNLTADEQTIVEDYLLTKWGIAL